MRGSDTPEGGFSAPARRPTGIATSKLNAVCKRQRDGCRRELSPFRPVTPAMEQLQIPSIIRAAARYRNDVIDLRTGKILRQCAITPRADHALPGGQSCPPRQLMPSAVGHTVLPAGPRPGKSALRTAASCIPAWPVRPTEVRTRILQEGLAIRLVVPAVSLRYRLRVLRLPYPTLILTPGRVAHVPSAVTFSLPLQVRNPVRALVLAERLTVGGPESPVVLSPAPWRLLTYPEQ